MGKKEGDLEELIIVIVILCICFCCISGIGVKIYKFYNTYTFLEKHEIKSLNDVKDFFKEMLEKLWDWIQCNILSFFLPDYKEKCFTDALILSQADEIELDSASPGSLADAKWELTADRVRLNEDFNKADEALQNLIQAITNRDSEGISHGGTEVQRDSEVLSWRAWITAQTGEMTHNLVNTEICDVHGTVVDFMDLAATGSKFRWSNRCKNRQGASRNHQQDCKEPSGPDEPGKTTDDWVHEDIGMGLEGLAGLAGLEDPSSKIHNDIKAFELGDFSGYTCNHYAKKYCKEGHFPDSNLEVFGSGYNWPELNCCACGGGSRADSNGSNTKRNKYEFIKKHCSGISTNPITEIKDNDIIENPNNFVNCDFNTLDQCMIDCDKDDCKGLIFRVRGNSSRQSEDEMNSGLSYHLDIMSRNSGQACERKIDCNVKNGSCTYESEDKMSIYKIYDGDGDDDDNDISYLLNRNSAVGTKFRCQSWADVTDQTGCLTKTAILKKMPLDFQTVGKNSSGIDTTSGEYTSYDVPYDTPTDKPCGKIDLPPDYKLNCPEERSHECKESGNCNRTECLLVSNCGNNNITCSPGEKLMKNVLCKEGVDCTRDKCCACKKKDTKLEIVDGKIIQFFDPYYPPEGHCKKVYCNYNSKSQNQGYTYSCEECRTVQHQPQSASTCIKHHHRDGATFTCSANGEECSKYHWPGLFPPHEASWQTDNAPCTPKREVLASITGVNCQKI